MNHLLSIVALTPAFGALVLLFIDEGRETLVRWIATVTAALALIASLPLWWGFQLRGAEWQFTERFDWMPAIGASYSVGVDGFSLLLVMLTTLLAFVAVLASWTGIVTRVKATFVAMLALQTGVLGVFVALDFLLFFAFWAVVLAAMWFLADAPAAPRMRSRTAFGLGLLAAGAIMLAGVLALYFHNHTLSGSYSFDIRTYQHLPIPSRLQIWIFIAFLLGFAITAGLFPFQTWLLDAEARAPAMVSMLLAALVLKIGAYGFVRLSLPILPQASRLFAPVLLVVALVGVLYGAVMAFLQSDWKRAVAYAGLGNISVALLGVFALTPSGLTGSIVLLVNHGISIAALLLIAGVVSERGRTTDIAAYGGLLKSMPLAAIGFLLATLSLAGLPGLNGFVGARSIFDGLQAINKIWAGIAVGGMVLGGACMLRLFARTMLGEVKNPASGAPRDLSLWELGAIVPLAALIVWIGLSPDPVLARLETSVARVVLRVSPEYAPEVEDCLKQAAPKPSTDPGLPAGMTVIAPCAESPGQTKTPHDK
jgi:NADH-quinone oxidoreductase subunit M